MTRGGAQRVASALLTLLVILALAAAAALTVVPRLLGGTSLTVLSGSMEPLYAPGDAVIVVPVDAADVRPGDVVAFQPVSGDPTLITHRVISRQLGGGPAGGYIVTQGDANNAADPPILPEQIRGRALYAVPAVGRLTLWAGERGESIMKATGLCLLGYSAFVLLRPSRRDPRPAAA